MPERKVLFRIHKQVEKRCWGAGLQSAVWARGVEPYAASLTLGFGREDYMYMHMH